MESSRWTNGMSLEQTFYLLPWPTSGPILMEPLTKLRGATVSLKLPCTLSQQFPLPPSWVTSTKHAKTYLNHILMYLYGLKELFPKYQFLSNHHMAIYLYEYLVFYSLVHFWWTFSFERIINMLQWILTNYKPSRCWVLFLMSVLMSSRWIWGNNLTFVYASK